MTYSNMVTKRDTSGYIFCALRSENHWSYIPPASVHLRYTTCVISRKNVHKAPLAATSYFKSVDSLVGQHIMPDLKRKRILEETKEEIV